MDDPVFRTLLLFDIEQYGRRDNVEQAFLRRLLYEVANATLLSGAVDETSRLRADRGDSVMELIDAQASVPRLVKTLLTETPALLHSKNRLMAESARMRLRIVLASGYVAVDEHEGWVGSDLNHAVRLLDSDPLREALRNRTDDCVLCVSDSIYQGVVSHGPLGVRPETFHRITVDTKEGPTVAWLHGEPGPTPPSEPATGSVPAAGSVPTSGSVPTPGTAAPQHSETHVDGDQYGQTGGAHHGDTTFHFTRSRRDEQR
ncbi:hypothetical protein ACIRF8_01960 [Streptomyces sp. NPDC102406]|uniref:hypothetical protein n=1 Tax=Streptomyces sp. NPDC102406 TaxID=3366171 RepID=UPI003818E72C